MHRRWLYQTGSLALSTPDGGSPPGRRSTLPSVLLPVADIVDIRTDDLGQPTLDNLVAGSRL